MTGNQSEQNEFEELISIHEDAVMNLEKALGEFASLFNTIDEMTRAVAEEVSQFQLFKYEELSK